MSKRLEQRTPLSDAAAIECSGHCDVSEDGQAVVTITFARNLETRLQVAEMAVMEKCCKAVCEHCALGDVPVLRYGIYRHRYDKPGFLTYQDWVTCNANPIRSLYQPIGDSNETE